MSLRIGVDFDNTIANYDTVFMDAARRMDLVRGPQHLSKAAIKERTLSRPDGDLIWQRLQGQVYGRHMQQATIYPGFVEFLRISRLRGHSVQVVSHKTEFGHFDTEMIPLRDAAIRWMRAVGIAGQGATQLSEQDICFEPTRDKKLVRILQLGCTHFIDDLEEVFEDPQFPVGTQRILFDPHGLRTTGFDGLAERSWREIASHLFGDWSEEEVLQNARVTFPGLGVESALLRNGRGNSRIYSLTGADGSRYALKVYPDAQRDPRRRLATEFEACRKLMDAGLPVPPAVTKDESLNWGVFGWIDGVPVQSTDPDILDKSADFVERLQSLGRSGAGFDDFPNASEACLSGVTIVDQIRKRLSDLLQLGRAELSDYLRADFEPALERAIRRARENAGDSFERPLSREFQLLSPSDFGAHNAIREASGRIVFIDFEYFGWDDPVKLACDYYWHPGMSLSAKQRAYWFARVHRMFSGDASFERRLPAYLPLYGFRWCLILLNEFLPGRLAHRIHAGSHQSEDGQNILSDQLGKSRTILGEVSEGL